MPSPEARIESWWTRKREERRARKKRRQYDRCWDDCAPGCWLPEPGKFSSGKSVDGCDGCDGVGGCLDCGSFSLLILGIAILNYFNTAPVRDGKRLARPALRLIRSYQQHVSAHRPAVCNLTPTCSAYGYNLIHEQGLRGIPALRQRLRDCGTAGRAKRTAAHG